MKLGSLISNQIQALKVNDTVRYALDLMKEHQVYQLPVVHQGKLLGLVYDHELSQVSELSLCSAFIHSKDFHSAGDDDSFILSWHSCCSQQLSILPVINEQEQYLGLVRQSDLLKYFVRNYCIADKGSVLVIQMRKLDYSLVKIAQLVEDCHSVILNSFISDQAESEKILITVNINSADPSTVINALERYEIDLLAVFSDETYKDNLRDRYDEFMKFLEV